MRRLGTALPGSCAMLVWLLWPLGACSERMEPRDFVDPAYTALQPMGWLGAEVQPLRDRLVLEEDDKKTHVGGLVLRELDEGFALALAGAQVGDVLVRVGQTFVPLKEDPRLDVLELFERQVSSGVEQVTCEVVRGEARHELAVAPDLTPLEEGLPLAVVRFDQAADQNESWLLSRQRENGGFADSEAPLALGIDALVALLLRAGEESEARSAAWERVTEHLNATVSSRLEQPTPDASPLSLGLFLLHEAERIGRLPDDVLSHAERGSSGAGPSAGASPIQLPAGARVITAEGGDLSKMLEQLREGGANVEIQMGEVPPGVLGKAAPVSSAGNSAKPDVDLQKLLQEHAPERLVDMRRLQLVTERVLTSQRSDGALCAVDASGMDAFFETALTTLGLAAARRVGVSVPAKALEAVVRFLRDHVEDGNLAAAMAKGMDRREVAGRASAVAFVLRVLECEEDDDLYRDMQRTGSRVARHLTEAPSHGSLRLLFVALLRRSGGAASWQTFYDQFRLTLIAQHGTASRALSCKNPGLLETALFGDLGAAALHGLLFRLQRDSLPVVLGRSPDPFSAAISGGEERATEADEEE